MVWLNPCLTNFWSSYRHTKGIFPFKKKLELRCKPFQQQRCKLPMTSCIRTGNRHILQKGPSISDREPGSRLMSNPSKEKEVSCSWMCLINGVERVSKQNRFIGKDAISGELFSVISVDLSCETSKHWEGTCQARAHLDFNWWGFETALPQALCSVFLIKVLAYDFVIVTLPGKLWCISIHVFDINIFMYWTRGSSLHYVPESML